MSHNYLGVTIAKDLYFRRHIENVAHLHVKLQYINWVSSSLFPTILKYSAMYVSDRAEKIKYAFKYQTTADELGCDLLFSQLCQHTQTGMYLIKLRK